MPSGPIGPEWAAGSWSDTAWEQYTWQPDPNAPAASGNEPLTCIGTIHTIRTGQHGSIGGLHFFIDLFSTLQRNIQLWHGSLLEKLLSLQPVRQ